MKILGNYDSQVEILDAAHITAEGEVGAYLNLKLRIPADVTDGGVELSPAVEADVTLDRWTAMGLSQAIANWVASKGDIA
ncbi:MAG: hypothetical protein GTO63_15820 [Anaerolineae bacterium]|nr:hypothetical protein [Anaerolineae bacterium]NIN96294.1 hypothetical protein [Anaerolineae bacterium]NIQ79314.1 hypothetical protein [Anaerolineae bacterium]